MFILANQRAIERWRKQRSDNSVPLRAFRAALGVTFIVLTLDFVGLSSLAQEHDTSTRSAAPVSRPRDVPGQWPILDAAPSRHDTHRHVLLCQPRGRAAPGTLANPGTPAPRRGGVALVVPDPRLAGAMTFELSENGRLMAIGTIREGTAGRFAAEIAKRGSAVKTVVLNSPGGSVDDAIQMGKLIRGQAYATEVPNGSYCASSCPLVLAGGVERRVGTLVTVGVHRPTPVGRLGGHRRTELTVFSGREQGPGLSEQMGVNPQVSVHAMQTPGKGMHIFKDDELFKLKACNCTNQACCQEAQEDALARRRQRLTFRCGIPAPDAFRSPWRCGMVPSGRRDRRPPRGDTRTGNVDAT